MNSRRTHLLIFALCLFAPSFGSAETHHVSVQNFSFAPQNITVQVGDTIQWNWVTGTHTVTSGPPGAPSGVFDEPSNSSNTVFSWVVDQPPGLMQYHCTPHWFANMFGSITIEPAGPTAVRHDVMVRNFEFDPAAVSIAAGDTVRWIWESGSHTTTSGASSAPVHNPGSLWDEVIDAGNPTFDFVFPSMGQYNYFCAPHEDLGMFGMVLVDMAVTGTRPEVTPGARLSAPAPNPSAGGHNFELSLDADAEVKVEVFDLQGRKVYETPQEYYATGTSLITWDGYTTKGESAAPGMYFVRVYAGETVFHSKVVRAASSHAHHH